MREPQYNKEARSPLASYFREETVTALAFSACMPVPISGANQLFVDTGYGHAAMTQAENVLAYTRNSAV